MPRWFFTETLLNHVGKNVGKIDLIPGARMYAVPAMAKTRKLVVGCGSESAGGGSRVGLSQYQYSHLHPKLNFILSS